MKATIWHNPRCSKSRAALAILEETPGVTVTVVEYLKTPPSRAEIAAVLAKAGLTPRDALRKGESVVKEIGLDTSDDAAILDAMAAQAFCCRLRRRHGALDAVPDLGQFIDEKIGGGSGAHADDVTIDNIVDGGAGNC